jgi:AcrR family transcriptional regulator
LAKSGNSNEIGRGASKREEREKRILDAAATLAQKWGYRKTTLEDIAKEARVAKGTIYLYWSTREKLFMAVIEREQVRLLEEIARRMDSDPEGMTLIGLVKHSILATLVNPITRAIVLQDSEALGEWIVREYNASAYKAQLEGYMALLQFLRANGLIRDDIDLQEQALAVVSAAWGVLLVNPLLPGDLHLSDEQMVAIVIITLKRLLEPDIPPSAEQRQIGEQTFRAYVKQLVAETSEH